MKLDSLQQSILKTLSYFDLMNFALTKEELFAYLWEPPQIKYEHFLSSLRKTQVDEAIPFSQKFSYFFLLGREEIVEERRKHLVISELKMKIAERAIKKIRCVPFIRAVLVCNSVGSYNADEESDVDFFIISAPGRVWLVRLFTNLLLRFYGLRTYSDNTKNKICLSFFVASDHLNLSSLRVADDDIHFAYWLHQMVPLYDPQNYYRRFLQANWWTKKYLPNINFLPHVDYLKKIQDTRAGNLWKNIWEQMWTGVYGDLLEKQARAVQYMKMKFSLKEKAEKGDLGVVLSDGIIKLHENDTRENVRSILRNI